MTPSSAVPLTLKPVGHALHRLAMLAVDDDLAFAVELGEHGVGLDDDRMAQAQLRRMAMLQRLGQLARQIFVVEAAERRVQGQQAAVDAEDGEAASLAHVHSDSRSPCLVGPVEAAHDDAAAVVEDLVPGEVAACRLEEDRRGAAAVTKPW